MDATVVSLMAIFGLVVAALALLGAAHRRGPNGAPRNARFKAQRIGGAVVAAAVALVLVFLSFVPGIIDRRIREATDITYKTFQEKVGKVPDRVTIDPTDRNDGDGWRYHGTAEFNDRETWDVTVTRTTDHARRETKLTCLVEPR